MYANKPSVLGLLDKLRVERGSHDSHIYMVSDDKFVLIWFSEKYFIADEAWDIDCYFLLQLCKLK